MSRLSQVSLLPPGVQLDFKAESRRLTSDPLIGISHIRIELGEMLI